MALNVGLNSYVTAVEADAYFAIRLRSSAWIDASAEDREKALLMAARELERERYAGSLAVADQEMAWPRSGLADAQGRTVESSSVPQAVMDAQCELAFSHLTSDRTEDDGNRGVRRMKAGAVEVEYSGSAPERRLPDEVLALLSPFLAADGGGFLDGSVRNVL